MITWLFVLLVVGSFILIIWASTALKEEYKEEEKNLSDHNGY
jgi:hypothetical protein